MEEVIGERTTSGQGLLYTHGPRNSKREVRVSDIYATDLDREGDKSAPSRLKKPEVRGPSLDELMLLEERTERAPSIQVLNIPLGGHRPRARLTNAS